MNPYFLIPQKPLLFYSESDLHEMLKNSPLQKTLEDIKRVLSERKQAPLKDGKKADEKKEKENNTGKERKAFTGPGKKTNENKEIL